MAEHSPAVVVTARSQPTQELAQAVNWKVQRLFRRSLQVRAVDAGSCNGCEWELVAALNAIYDLQRLGVDIVASPRHADALLVTGMVTRNLELALLRTFEATPHPKLVIAVGACAGTGCVFRGSYAVHPGVGEVLPVDVYIPGCPPTPGAILQGLLVAMGRLEPPARRQEFVE
ncbi:MAG: NADH-quinone oxidoreductase subunit NuoB [Deinococcus sp.]|nr:NADH-quinone oxidoreductase subunit NuoB [Deinococcus sp.]